MPHSTFFHLPAEKREKLLTCAMEEFARVPYPDASINRIVRASGISRGGFYLYFIDKEDLFTYLLSQYAQRFIQLLSGLLDAHQGALFPAFESLFDQVQALFRSPQSGRGDALALEVLRQNAGLHCFMFHGRVSSRDLAEQILPHIDFQSLWLEHREDQEDMLHILLHTAGPLLYEGLLAEDPAPVRARYRDRLRILARGMEKPRSPQ